MGKENYKKIKQIEDEISKLPVGYISKKNIRGKTSYYRQWKENGKVKSEYINPAEVDYVIELIDKRRDLQEELKLEIYRSDTSEKGLRRFGEYSKKLNLQHRVGIGHQDFEELVSNKLFYIDKTRFIKEWWENNDAVTLITRPRRFGKTLNLSMINCFFSNQYEGRSDLFCDYEVWRSAKMQKLQGTMPVISLSFGAIKQSTKRGQIEQMKLLISSAFIDNDSILPMLEEADQRVYLSYYKDITDEMAVAGIQVLSELMSKAYGNKEVIILLDEYDTPMLEAWVAGKWDECSSFMRMFFNATFKTNKYLKKALITGITRISKESFFSDMNNLKVCSMTSRDYQEAFGFLEKEVFEAMDAQKLTNKAEVKEWYDGFTIGDRTDIYNPWSIINYLREHELQPYWINSSSNKMIDEIFKRGDKELKYALEDLLAGKNVTTPMDEETPFEQIHEDNSAVWSLLYASGYVKIIETIDAFFDKEYVLAVTNKEVYQMFKSFVKDWFGRSSNGYKEFIAAMLSNDVDYMNEYLSRICKRTFSYYDVNGEEPERFYHGFVLGMLVDLEDRYIITSNRESGLGRYDVVLEPREKNNLPAIIMEFKVHRARKEKSLEEAVQNALSQIDEKKYESELVSRGIREENIYKYGIAFEGKTVLCGGKISK